MKKHFYIGILLLASSCFTACNNDKDIDSIGSVEVVSAQTSIEGDGGSAIIATAGDIVSATSSDNWLAVTIDNNKVVATAQKNESLQSRHTIVTIKDAQGGVSTVNVSQYGLVLFLKNNDETPLFNDNAGEISYEIFSNTGISVSSGVDWAKASLQDGKLKVNVTANHDGHIRSGYVFYKNDQKTDSLLIRQGEFKDVEGYYMLIGYNMNMDIEQMLVQLISHEQYPVALKVIKNLKTNTECDWTVPCYFDDNTLTLKMYNGSYCGIIPEDTATHSAEKYVANVMIDAVNGRLFYDKTSSMKLQFDYNAEYGTYGLFQNDVAPERYSLNGFQFAQFKALPTSTATAVNNGVLATFIYPQLYSVSMDDLLNEKVSSKVVSPMTTY